MVYQGVKKDKSEASMIICKVQEMMAEHNSSPLSSSSVTTSASNLMTVLLKYQLFMPQSDPLYLLLEQKLGK